MKQYFVCSLYFKFDSIETEKLLKRGLELLGFLPSSMSIYISFDEMIEEVAFEKEYLLSLVRRSPLSIKINENQIDNDDHAWFRIKIEEENITSLHWNNSSLDFLINSKSFETYLQSNNFICGYGYNKTDNVNQSITDISYFKAKKPNEAFLVKKTSSGEIVDVSKNWGRSEYAEGLEFMAAPLMWFGQEFYKLIPKEKLLEFPYSSIEKSLSLETVSIKLFPLYDNPQNLENRRKQENFWKFFQLDEVIEIYAKENFINPNKSLNDFLFKMKQKKKR